MSEEMLHLVSRRLVEHFGTDADVISPSATLEDLGLDSMALVELLLILEEEFGTPMPEDDESAPRTLGELVERVERVERIRRETAAPAATGGAAS